MVACKQIVEVSPERSPPSTSYVQRLRKGIAGWRIAAFSSIINEGELRLKETA